MIEDDGAIAASDLRTVLDALPERILLHRQSDLLVRHCNTATAADHGLTPGEIVGRRLTQVLPPGEANRLLAHVHGLEASCPQRRRTTHHRGRVVEWVDQLVGGSSATDVLSVGRDVTRQREVEHAHREVDARLRIAVGEAPIGMALVGLDQRILEVNRALCDLLGRSEAELLELTTPDVTHPDDVELDREYGRQLLAGTPRSETIEKRFVRGDGSVVWGCSSRPWSATRTGNRPT